MVVELILKHLQNLQIGTDPWKVINQLLDFRVKCCEGAKFHYFPIFFKKFFLIFSYLVISMELHKHAKVKIKASHKASVINGYWKTQSFCKY